MKQKEIVSMIVAGFVGIILAIIVSKLIFIAIGSNSQQIDIVPRISTTFPLPNKQYFNNNSIDPTPLINIGPSNNSSIFSKSTTN